jgi:hypothetical protein
VKVVLLTLATAFGIALFELPPASAAPASNLPAGMSQASDNLIEVAARRKRKRVAVKRNKSGWDYKGNYTLGGQNFRR